jgi:adenosylcobinamide-GDP ribazoletransferase
VDGLGDTCDGFYAFKGKDRIIEIMKDSRIGSYACIAIVVDILLKVSSLTYIIENKLGFIIILAPIIGRLSIIFISLIGKPAKSTGSGNLFIGNMNRIIVFFAALLSFAISMILIGVTNSVIIFLISFIVTILVNKYSESKINGITGDLLGANNELVEIFVLITYIAINVLSNR